MPAHDRATQPARVPRGRGASFLLGAAAVVALAAALGGAAWWLAGERTLTYTDGTALNRPADDARPRAVLWTDPEALPEPVDGPGEEYEPRLSADATRLYFVRGRPGHNADIYVTRREGGAWSDPVALALNTADDELGPTPAPDGSALYFYSDRPGGLGGYDLWIADAAPDGSLGAPRNLGPAVNSPFNDYGPAPTPDGSALWFASNRPVGFEPAPGDESWRATIREDLYERDYDLYAAPITDVGPGFGPLRRVDALCTGANDGSPAISPAGDFVYFASDRAGGVGGFDLYRARLAGGGARDAEPLGAPINTIDNELDPSLASLGFELHFSSDRPGRGPSADATAFADAITDGYGLWRAESREVYLAAGPREARWHLALPYIPWLLLLALLLLLLGLLSRAASSPAWQQRWRTLSLLARCVIASLLLHALLAALFAAWQVKTTLEDLLRPGSGTKIQLVSSAVSSGVASQVRGSLTNASAAAPAPGMMTVSATLASGEPLRLEATEPARTDAAAARAARAIFDAARGQPEAEAVAPPAPEPDAAQAPRMAGALPQATPASAAADAQREWAPTTAGAAEPDALSGTVLAPDDATPSAEPAAPARSAASRSAANTPPRLEPSRLAADSDQSAPATPDGSTPPMAGVRVARAQLPVGAPIETSSTEAVAPEPRPEAIAAGPIRSAVALAPDEPTADDARGAHAAIDGATRAEVGPQRAPGNPLASMTVPPDSSEAFRDAPRAALDTPQARAAPAGTPVSEGARRAARLPELAASAEREGDSDAATTGAATAGVLPRVSPLRAHPATGPTKSPAHEPPAPVAARAAAPAEAAPGLGAPLARTTSGADSAVDAPAPRAPPMRTAQSQGGARAPLPTLPNGGAPAARAEALREPAVKPDLVPSRVRGSGGAPTLTASDATERTAGALDEADTGAMPARARPERAAAKSASLEAGAPATDAAAEAARTPRIAMPRAIASTLPTGDRRREPGEARPARRGPEERVASAKSPPIELAAPPASPEPPEAAPPVEAPARAHAPRDADHPHRPPTVPGPRLPLLPRGTPELPGAARPRVALDLPDAPPKREVTLAGMVLDARTREPVAGAVVRLSQIAGDLGARTAEDGRFSFVAPELPEQFAVAATREGYTPGAAHMAAEDVRDGRRMTILLEPVAETVIALEPEPRVHHLGNDSFSGRVNSQFQQRSEGTRYAREFEVAAGQLAPPIGRAELRMLAKGAQLDNQVLINGTRLDAHLTGSPEDGSYGVVRLAVPLRLLRAGANAVEIRAVQRAGTDIDDFEFINIQLHLLPGEAEPAPMRRLRNSL